MSGTLVIGYGTFGANCVRDYSKVCSQPVLLIDNHPFSEQEDNFLIDHLVLEDDVNLNITRLKNTMSDYAQVLLISSIGGESFSQAYNIISECARLQKTALISLYTIPFAFESERRTRALEALPSMSHEMSNIFVIDLQKVISKDCSPTEFLSYTLSFISSTTVLLVKLLELSPFFSLCSEPLYTISLGHGNTYPESVENALEHPYFDVASNKGKVLVCSYGRPSTFEAEQVQSRIMALFGALPEMITYSGLEDGQAIVFIPISYLSG